ncbi:MAG TPA: hypothetical protein VMS74_12525 [Acidimicrobiia bacterium]|nr:hypothetical protein [Acidimicrobiia bacterium]
MNLRSVLIGVGALFVVLVILAFTPLVDGGEGTWQNTVGDVVWTGIFVTFAAFIVLGIMWLVRRRRAPEVR